MSTPHAMMDERRDTGAPASTTGPSAAVVVAVYVALFGFLLPLFLIVTALRLDELAPVAGPASPAWALLGGALLVSGTGTMAYAMVLLWRRGRGLPISHLPPTRFVATGPYRLVRHPIYVGFTAAVAGLALVLSSFWMLAFCTPLLVVGWISYVRIYEEPALVDRFGESYCRYRREVGLFGPKRMRARPRIDRLAAHLTRWLTAAASHTVLYQRGRFILVTYGALIAVGTVLMMQHLASIMLAQGLSVGAVGAFLGGGALASMFFARLFWWAGTWRERVREPLLGLRKVGFVSWGALFGLLLVAGLHAWVYDVSLLVTADALTASMFIGYAFGRIGCLTYGCCYGRPTHRYGVEYRSMQAKVLRECGWAHPVRHPTQVYSSLHGLALVVVLNVLVWTAPPLGLTTALGFMLYAAGRAVIEWYRDRRRHVRGLFTSGHAGCLAVFAIGWTLLFVIEADVVLHTWSTATLAASVALTPLVLLLGVVVLLVMGSHWEEIGRW